MIDRHIGSNDRPSPRAHAALTFLVIVIVIGTVTLPARAQAPGAESGASAQHPAAPAATPPGPAAPAATPPGATGPAAATRRNIAGPGDYALRERLIDQIRKDPELAQESFGLVLVNGGVVFSGKIRSYALKMRVLRIAAVQAGVINVTDEMEVPRGEVTDAALRDAVEAQLTDKNAAIGIRDLRVGVEDGVATVGGTVDTYATRVRAEAAAGTVLGVRRISNHLMPADAPSGTDDGSLTGAVVTYLKDFRQFAYAADLRVKTSGGIVTLTGRVPLLQARQLAAALTAMVGGVKGVDNRIDLDVALIVQHRTIVEPGT
jgi:osmotically-inducible protein OsmY